jgi:thiol-disulfide isomerase/thioredoxin
MPGADPFASCDPNPSLPYDRPLRLRMRVLDGPDFDLEAYRGYAVWINMMATWCGPCNHEQPAIVQMAHEYYGRGLRVIGMDYRESDNDVRAYRKKYSLTYPIAMDESGAFMSVLQAGYTGRGVRFPAHLLITPDGHLNCYRMGSVGLGEIRQRLDPLVSMVKAPSLPGPIATSTPAP